jgi:hypothetical protein
MDASWVAAIASVASAFIVAVAAIAAVLQIRHIRNANEITVYLRLTERLDSPATHAAFDAIAPFIEKLAKDESLRLRLVEPDRVEEFDEIEDLVRFLDTLTVLIIVGSLAERLVLIEHAENIVRLWGHVGEAIYLRRKAYGRQFGTAFEHLAMRAKSYLDAGGLDRIYQQLQRDPRFTGPS